MKIALLCGGPSRERGISLNSARSVMDHLSALDVDIRPVYFNPDREAYALSPRQLYSNTPADFDFKLREISAPLAKDGLIAHLQDADLVFPVIHGAFGEDGELQSFLEQHDIPFIGPRAETCRQLFNKHGMQQYLKSRGDDFIENYRVESTEDAREAAKKIGRWPLILKPAQSGSSIGVTLIRNEQDLTATAPELLREFSLLVAEPYLAGREFTLIILEGPNGRPVALLPTEIEMEKGGGQIFDYRRKYLPTNATYYHTPARFPAGTIAEIRRRAEAIFADLKIQDFCRFDGWLTDDGKILFTDFNPIGGLEQNSFIFRQATRIGMSHADLLSYLMTNGCKRRGMTPPARRPPPPPRQPVHVLFGGKTAERQVSLMSGTNVWLKLRQSQRFAPEPFLLDKSGGVWHLPYDYTIDHTVEDIARNCTAATEYVKLASPWIADIRQRLDLSVSYKIEDHQPRHMSFGEFIALSKKSSAFVFLGLHGGEGEDGRIQRQLDKAGLLYNGCGPEGAEICMDKARTGEVVNALKMKGVSSAPKISLKAAEILKDTAGLWQKLVAEWKVQTLLIKPRSDGCSAGVLRLQSAEELKAYAQRVLDESKYIPARTFHYQPVELEMPQEDSAATDFLLEAFIETDRVRVTKGKLEHTPHLGWLELTIGVLEENGTYHALNPSISVAEASVLSLEEKFQGGTGINITPPPESLITAAQRQRIQEVVAQVSAGLKIENYARLDLFFNRQNDAVIIIEANTLPALTPSTVIYHQALAETPPLTPLAFLEKLIDMKSATPARDSKRA